MHDDGCIIKGEHDYVPEGYKKQYATHCKSCDWCNVVGVITNNFDIIKAVRLNYERFGGGFTFGHYVNTLTDEMGNPLENERLNTWIKVMNKEQHHDHENEFLEKNTYGE